ncbi:hypothetical protein FGIG_11846 [Fasciola gigantica]|uniref:Uncharacterized protein n=1 Tax=Fasciola gigantica TaxID=46835 RepID=A0A504YGM9_FASGI|nr:hypothetical protein FGIG_11846 [Fasciola gigantica]
MRRYRSKQVPVPGFSRTTIWRRQKASVRAACATVGILNASDIDIWLNACKCKILRNAGNDAQDLQASEDEENSWLAHPFRASGNLTD